MFLRCASSSESVRTIVRSGTVERAPASYASRRIEWVQPQFGSGARCDPRYMAKAPVSRLEWDVKLMPVEK
jgi:hypothetical protein